MSNGRYEKQERSESEEEFTMELFVDAVVKEKKKGTEKLLG